MPSIKNLSPAISSRPANIQVKPPVDDKTHPPHTYAEVPTKLHITALRPKSNVAVEAPVTGQPAVLSVRPLSTESSKSSQPPPPIQMSLTSRPITLPPRPQPGRKPLQDQHGTKRQEQNRSAQRNFRKRKAETLVQLKEDNEVLRQEKQEIQVAAQSVQNDVERALIEARAKVETLEKQVKEHVEARERAEKDMARLREEMAELRREVERQRAVPTQQPSTLAQSMPAPRKHNLPTTPTIYNKPSSMLTSLILPPIQARNCGSCEPKTCVCFAESVQLPDADIVLPEPEVEQQQQDHAVDFTSWRPTTTLSSSQAPKRMAPGSCERCQVDPEQRAYCVGLAQQSSSTSSSNATHEFKRPRLTDTSVTSSRNPSGTGLSMPCIEAYPLYKRFERVASSVTEDQLRAEVLRKRMRVGAASAFSNLPTPPLHSPPLSGNTIVRLTDGGISRDGVQFSAHEVDVSQVLASLRNAGPSSGGSVGSSRSNGSDEVRTPGYEGEDLGSPATSVAEGLGGFEKPGASLGTGLQSPSVFETERGFRF